MGGPVLQDEQGGAATRRHRPYVRLTHWLLAVATLGLLATGVGILLSHPRLYWGETGGIGMPSLIDLPLPFVLGPSIWNRPYHFFFAWLLAFAWLAYILGGILTRHFLQALIPSAADLRWRNISNVTSAHLRGKRTATDEAGTYNVVQCLTYLAVAFFLFPGVMLTGLGMSPTVTSVFPILATGVGGHQSARTLHFAFACLLLLFLVVHVAMLFVAGFRRHVGAMITGRIRAAESET